MYLSEHLQKKWAPILDHPELGNISDPYRKAVTTVLLENQEKSMQEDNQVLSSQNFLTEGQASGAFPDVGGVAKYDPIMISLVRRAMPNLIAYDVCGVQPMTGPTGLIFAMRARYVTMNQSPEALYNEADTSFASNTSAATQDTNVPGIHIHTDGSANASQTLVAGGLSTAQGEVATPNNMAFSIEKVTVTAKTRA